MFSRLSLKKFWKLSLTIVFFLTNNFSTIKDAKAAVLNLPEPSKLLVHEGNHSYPMLLGLKIDPQNPLKIDFIIDGADTGSVNEAEAKKIISYFFAGLTMPNDSLWVNLSPYEKDRIMDDKLAQTNLGKALLEQDYVLKQLSSSLTHPETKSGRSYWEKVKSDFGADAFNKIWISPDKVEVHEKNNTVIITKSSLKAELEGDYQAAASNGGSSGQGSVSSSLKETVLPLIIDELQSGEHFAPMRQIYNSLILSMWFKKKFKESFFKAYFDQSKISGIQLKDDGLKEKVFNLYVEAFKKGVYDFVKKEYDRSSRQKRKTRYFAGGATFSSSVLADKMVINNSTRYNFGFLYDKAISMVSVDIDEALERTYMAIDNGVDDVVAIGYEAAKVGSIEEQNMLKSRFNRQRLDKALELNPHMLAQSKRIRAYFDRGVIVQLNNFTLINNGTLAARYAANLDQLDKVFLYKTDDGYKVEDKRRLSPEARSGLLEILPTLNKTKVNLDLGLLANDVIDVAGELQIYAWEHGLDFEADSTLTNAQISLLRDYANGKVDKEQLESEFSHSQYGEAILAVAENLRTVFEKKVKEYLYKEQTRLIIDMYGITDTKSGPIKDLSKIKILFNEAYEQNESFDEQRVRDFIQSKDIAELMRNFGAKYTRNEDIPSSEKDAFVDAFVYDFKRTVEGFDSYVESVIDLSTSSSEEIAATAEDSTLIKEYRKEKVSSSLDFYEEKSTVDNKRKLDGGVNLRDMDIQADASSSIIEFAPFDMKNFHGFKFNINSIQKRSTNQVINILKS